MDHPVRRLARAAERMEIAGATTWVASLDDLIATKRAAGRLQDQTDTEALEAIKRLRSRPS